MSDIAIYFGITASILLPLIPFPQLYQIYRTKTAKDISIVYIVFQIIANAVFLVYGSLKYDLYVIIPNTLLIFFNIIMACMKYYYQKTELILPK